MKRAALVAVLSVCAGVPAGRAEGQAPPSPYSSAARVEQQSRLDQEKQNFIAQSTAAQTGTVQRLSVGRLTLEPYNPASDLIAFLVPQATPIYQGNEKVTQNALVPGASVRIHFRYSPTANQPARAIAIEILSVSESRSAKSEALLSPPVMNEGRGQIPAVPTPEKAEVLADASGSMVGRIDRIGDNSLLLGAVNDEDRKLKLDPFVSVFQGPFRVGTDLLEPGRDVRVYYKQASPDGTPTVIAVELLEQTEVPSSRSTSRTP